MLPRRDIVAPVFADLTDRLRGVERPVRFSVAWNGDLFFLVDRRPPPQPTHPSRRLSPRSTYDHPTPQEVMCISPRGIDSLEIIDRTAFHYVQPLPEGLLLVGARCSWTRKGPEQNAAIYDPSGHVVRRLTLGDGIQDVRTTERGEIWVSYFDEGVLGNRGWNGPGPEPIGAAGLVQFDTSGCVRFRYDPEAAKTDMICDLYAMNVASNGETWAYFYEGFPLVRIHDGEYTRWRSCVAGAHAFAVTFPHVLFHGGYKERGRGCTATLHESDGIGDVREARFIDEHGKPLGEMAARGAGGRLYLFDGRVVRRVEHWETWGE